MIGITSLLCLSFEGKGGDVIPSTFSPPGLPYTRKWYEKGYISTMNTCSRLSRCERLYGWGMPCCFQQMQGGKDDGQLPITTMWQTQRTPHDMWCNQCTWRLEQLCIRAKCFDVDAHRWDSSHLDGACYVTHGHITNGSASCQEDGIHAIILEHLRPLGCAFIHQARNISETMIGVIALC